ncbi:MAG: hypothetical protein ACREE7_05905, partial [Dongiaceae bacterium]
PPVSGRILSMVGGKPNPTNILERRRDAGWSRSMFTQRFNRARRRRASRPPQPSLALGARR